LQEPPTRRLDTTIATANMSVDYLLHESPVGYAVFKVIIAPDTIGSRLKEVQQAVQDLDKFGKTVELVSLAP
jgi:nucleolar protein 56